MFRRQILVYLVVLASVGQAAEKAGGPKVDPNLAGWWKFDETAGEKAMDSSGHGRIGTLKDPLSFDENSAGGRLGRAIRLDGKDPYVQIERYKGVTGTRPRTVSAWIKTTTSRGEIISWGTEDFGQMFTFGFVRGRIGITPHGGYFYMNRATHDDEWHHVAAVVAEAELPNLHDDVTLYLDGVEAEIHDIGLLDLWPLETGNKLDVRIGRKFKGLLDELRLYDRPLAPEEIQALFKLQTGQSLSRNE